MSNQATPTPITLTYSKVKNLSIKLDAYVPPVASGTLPGIVFFHGGGLVTGSRNWFSTTFLVGE